MHRSRILMSKGDGGAEQGYMVWKGRKAEAADSELRSRWRQKAYVRIWICNGGMG